MNKKELEIVENEIVSIENKVIQKFQKILYKFCDENKVGFTAGNGNWELVEQNGLEKTDDWKYAFYRDSYPENCLYRDGTFSNKIYRERVTELADKFKKIYDLGWGIAGVVRRECNILCLCDDYRANFNDRY